MKRQPFVPFATPRGVVLLVASIALFVAGCGAASDGRTSPSQTTSASAPTASTPAPQAPDGIAMILGDSYVSGYWPVDSDPEGQDRGTWADQVAAKRNLTPVNFGCFGIKAIDYLDGQPCQPQARSADMPDLAGQATGVAALNYMAADPGRVKIVVIVLGANDVADCLRGGSVAAVSACADTRVAAATPAIARLVTQTRDIVGPEVPIVGIDYVDVWATDARLHDDSIAVLRDRLDPALRATYTDNSAVFVDVDAADLDPCTASYFCTLGDEHLTPAGHAQVSAMVNVALATAH